MLGAREVLLERAVVDLEGTVAGADDHSSDGALALAGRLDLRIGGDVDRARRDGLVVLVRGGSGLAGGAFLLLGLEGGALLGGELALLGGGVSLLGGGVIARG